MKLRRIKIKTYQRMVPALPYLVRLRLPVEISDWYRTKFAQSGQRNFNNWMCKQINAAMEYAFSHPEIIDSIVDSMVDEIRQTTAQAHLRLKMDKVEGELVDPSSQ